MRAAIFAQREPDDADTLGVIKSVNRRLTRPAAQRERRLISLAVEVRCRRTTKVASRSESGFNEDDLMVLGLEGVRGSALNRCVTLKRAKF